MSAVYLSGTAIGGAGNSDIALLCTITSGQTFQGTLSISASLAFPFSGAVASGMAAIVASGGGTSLNSGSTTVLRLDLNGPAAKAAPYIVQNSIFAEPIIQVYSGTTALYLVTSGLTANATAFGRANY